MWLDCYGLLGQEVDKNLTKQAHKAVSLVFAYHWSPD